MCVHIEYNYAKYVLEKKIVQAWVVVKIETYFILII